MLLAMQPIGGLLAGIDDALPKLFQLLVDLIPVVLELFENLLQRLGKRSLEVGIIIEFNVEVVTDGVFDLGSLGLRPGSSS